ncbi:hypothetical protein PMAC_001714 [Pneumocystis sp. 'macacae']|nr:hypothetical protein PMAC_001714 [Pneumocystis sp. 'macacae']
MIILQFDLTKFEYASKEQKSVILSNTLLEISEKLENLELKQLNEKQTEILQTFFKIIRPEVLVPSRIIRNHLGRCFEIIFSKGNCTTLFDTFNTLKNILLSESKNNLHIKWTILIIIKHIYIASGNKLSIHLNDTINLISKIFKISNNICELYASCFETLSEALNSYDGVVNEINTKKVFKFIKSGLSNRTDIVKLKALICFKNLIKVCISVSGYTDINTVKTIATKFIDEPNFSIHNEAAKTIAIALISSSKSSAKDSTSSKKDKEIQSNNIPKANVSPKTIGKYTYYSSDIEKQLSFTLKHISDMYAKYITNPRIESFIKSIYSKFLEHYEKDWIVSHYRFIIKNHIYDIASIISSIKDKQKILITKNIICHLLDIMKKKLDEASQFKIMKILNNEYLSIWLHKADLTQAKKVILTSILYELSNFILTLNYTVNIIRVSIKIRNNKIIILKKESLRNNLLFTLNCTSLTVQKYASWCIKCFAISIPSDMTYLTNFCLNYVKEFISTDIDNIDFPSKLRIRGHALALSRLISLGKQNSLYISSDILSEIFSVSCSILKLTINNTVHATIIPIQVAWILISSLMKLGSSFVRGFMSQLFILWENTLLKPSVNNLSTQINHIETLFLLYTREYALGSIFSFLLYNKKLLTADVLKKISIMISETNTILIFLKKKQKSDIFLDKYVHLSQEMLEVMVEKRILQCYLLIIWKNPADTTQSELISRLITNFANPYISTIKNISNKLYYYCQSNQNIGGTSSFVHLQDFSEHQEIYGITNNNILQNYIYIPKEYNLINRDNFDSDFQKHNPLQIHNIFLSFDEIPSDQLSIHIEIIDLSILLFGAIFLNQSNKIKESILEQLITFITFSSSTKHFQQNNTIICNSNLAILGILRLKKKQFIPSFIEFHIKQIIEINDPNIRSGNALCLGRILNHYGRITSSSYINQILDVLQFLSTDYHPTVCFWALESITIGIQSFGPNISLYCLNILNIISKIYSEIDYNISNISASTSNLSLKFPILNKLAKCLNAVINIFGPDLERNMEAKKLVSILIKGFLLENDEKILATAIYCTQHILLFSSDLLNPYLLIKLLQKNMLSKHENLARASIKSLYQLIQHNILNVFEWRQNNLDVYIWLAYDLNPECQDLKNIVEIWLHHTSDSQQNYWIQLCLKTFEKNSFNRIHKVNKNIDMNFKDEGFYNFKIGKNHWNNSNNIQEKLENLRWQTQKLILQCINVLLSRAESFFEGYSDSQIPQKISVLSSNISNLIKIGFIASTAKNHNFRLEGLKIIQRIIKIFSPLKDPYFPTSSLLEQYEAQLVSAIIPSFSNDSIPEIAALAIHICSYFLTSDVLKEVPETGRIIKLLTSALLNSENTISIGDLKYSNNNFQIILKLSIISSWAELQIASQNKSYLNSIIKPNLTFLTFLWITSLKDYAKFCFETHELSSDLTYTTSQSIDFSKIFLDTNNNELFEICNKFKINVIYAIAILSESNKDMIFKAIDQCKLDNLNIVELDNISNHKKKFSTLFFLLFGLCFEALLDLISNKKAINTEKQKLYILLAFEKILNISLHNEIIYYSPIFSELITLFKRLLLIEHPIIQILIIKITTNLINNFPPENTEFLKKNENCENKFEDKEKDISRYSEQLFELSKIIILPFMIYFKNLNSNINNNDSSINSYNLIPKILPLVKMLCEDILTVSKTSRENYEVSQNLVENIIEQIIKIIKKSSSSWNYGLLLITTIITITGQILSPKSKSTQKYCNLFIESQEEDKAKILIYCMKSLLKSSFCNIQQYIFQSILFASLNIIKKTYLDSKQSHNFDMGINACDIIIDFIKNITENNRQYIAIIVIIPILIRFTSIKELESKHKREISSKLLSIMAYYSENIHQILEKIPKKESDMLKKMFKSTAYSNMSINLDHKPKISLKKKFID